MEISKSKTSLRSSFLFIFIFLALRPSLAQNDSIQEKKLNFFADTRIRIEEDWNVRGANAVLNEQRTRMRFRFRFGFNYQWSKEIKFGARMRSGVPEDQQSPHWTLGKEFEVYSFKIDRVYIKGEHKNFWWWAGKNDYPFWKQNELFWDDDVVPEGMSLGTKISLGETLDMQPVGGIFISKSAGTFFKDDGIFYGGQLAFIKEFEKSRGTFSSGIFNFRNLLDLNQKPLERNLNYTLWMSSVQYRMNLKYPLTAGLDFVYNLEDYSSVEWISNAGLKDERTGFVTSLSLGSTDQKGDWQVGYRYAQIRKYSVVDYFAQDDWVSWSFPDGTPGTRSSNFQGHEIQAAFAFGPGFNVVTRLYLVQGLKKNNPSDISLESANRFRVDLNIGF
ncbi:MAG: hypothetical protein GY931_08110 [Maribacter sp.]|nr:hypothetical protein [Maribacter sp.]